MNEKQMSRQKSFEYCMYMIFSSYFEKVVLKTPYQEKRLLLHYKETKQQEQFSMEEQCIKYMEKVKESLPPEVWEQPMEVRLVGQNNGEYTELRFESEPYIICVKADARDKRAKINLVFGRKKEVNKA